MISSFQIEIYYPSFFQKPSRIRFSHHHRLLAYRPYTKELGDFTTLLASIIIRHISKSNFLSFFPPKQFHEPSSTCNAETKKKVLNVPKFPPFVALSRNNSVFLPQAHLTLGYLSPFHRFLFTGIKCSNQPLIEKCNQKWDKP